MPGPRQRVPSPWRGPPPTPRPDAPETSAGAGERPKDLRAGVLVFASVGARVYLGARRGAARRPPFLWSPTKLRLRPADGPVLAPLRSPGPHPRPSGPVLFPSFGVSVQNFYAHLKVTAVGPPPLPRSTPAAPAVRWAPLKGPPSAPASPAAAAALRPQPPAPLSEISEKEWVLRNTPATVHLGSTASFITVHSGLKGEETRTPARRSRASRGPSPGLRGGHRAWGPRRRGPVRPPDPPGADPDPSRREAPLRACDPDKCRRRG